MQDLILTSTAIVFVIVLAIANGYIALQLLQLKYESVTARQKGEKYKGYWHLAMGGAFLVAFIGLALLGNGNFLVNLFYLISIHFLLYDVSINFVRKRFGWEFTGTCEDWKAGFDWDWDCVTLKIDKIFGIKFIRVGVFLLAVYLKFGR